MPISNQQPWVDLPVSFYVVLIIVQVGPPMLRKTLAEQQGTRVWFPIHQIFLSTKLNTHPVAQNSEYNRAQPGTTAEGETRKGPSWQLAETVWTGRRRHSLAPWPF